MVRQPTTLFRYSRTAGAIASAGVMLVLATPTQARAEAFIFDDPGHTTPETSLVIRNVKQAKRYFGRVGKKDEVEYYSVTAPKDTLLEFELDVPKADLDFKPTITFFGPGLGKSKEDPVIALGEGNGAVVDTSDDWGTYFDRSTLTTFARGPRLKIALPKEATYALAIRSPNGKTGRYALRLKGQDDFKWDELTERLSAVLRAIFRMY